MKTTIIDGQRYELKPMDARDYKLYLVASLTPLKTPLELTIKVDDVQAEALATAISELLKACREKPAETYKDDLFNAILAARKAMQAGQDND